MKTKSSVRTQAARWLFALETSDCFEELWPRFQAWLQQDVRHREAYQSLEKAWRQVASLSDLRPDNEPMDPDLLFKMGLRKQPSGRTATRTKSRAIGAVVSTMLVAFWVWNGLGGFQHEIALAARGFLLPPDDSTMTLNAQSGVIPVLVRRVRNLETLRGEVFLKAQHEPQRLFKVRGGDAILQASGTQFSLGKMSDNDVHALAEEGRLEITPASPGTADSTRESPLILEAGQGAVIDGEGIRAQILDPTQVGDRLSWREGKLSFSNETLSQAVEEFNRYNRRKLQIDDPDMANMILPGGVYENSDPVGFAEALKRVSGVEYESDDSGASAQGVIHLRRSRR